MPTPVGHAIGGLAAALLTNSATRRAGLPPVVFAAAAAAAILPDFDILAGSHRTYTHSIGAVPIVWAIAWICLLRAPHKAAAATAVAAGYASHPMLDWLGKDTSSPPGLMVLWPFSSRFYMSGLDLFDEVSRRYWLLNEFILGNMRAVGWEVLMLLPVALAAWIYWSGRTVRSG